MSGAKLRRALIGLALAVGPFAFMPVPILAQDYIDVEAERRAQQAQTPGQARPGVATGAVSYGVGNAPAATTDRLPPPPPLAADNIGGLFNQVQQLQQEVMRLNGIVEQQAYELQQLKEQSLERYLDIDRRLAAGGGAAGGAAAASAGSAASGGAAAPIQPAGGQDTRRTEQPGEAEAYRAAYALVRGQEFDAAVDAFTTFLRSYPDGRYAPNAHYWLGELYLVIEPADPEAARQAFTLLLNEYPDNAKVPDALYKLGRVQYIKGNPQRAREYLERVIREYPDSSAARLAGDFLDQNL
ncbi:MAG: tol-pal system protein YbgF [Halieaceae bacterium]|jgi:tol-pal system protein YbgF|nr:tol-pal system protein YbgF [Halieaceae bacterium]